MGRRDLVAKPVWSCGVDLLMVILTQETVSVHDDPEV